MSERRVPARLRRIVEKRARGCCEYCLSQAAYSAGPYSTEHVQARVLGGTDDLDNLALSCQGCNNHKYDKVEAPDPLSGDPAPLYHPRRDRWTDHFAWSGDYQRVVGLTPAGRATVQALHLNRPNLVNLRRLMHAAGEHPPRQSEGSE